MNNEQQHSSVTTIVLPSVSSAVQSSSRSMSPSCSSSAAAAAACSMDNEATMMQIEKIQSSRCSNATLSNMLQQGHDCRDHIMLLNKLGAVCLSQKKLEDAQRSFASALCEMRKHAPLSCLFSNAAHKHRDMFQNLALLGNKSRSFSSRRNSSASTASLESDTDNKPDTSLYIYQREDYDEGMYVYRDTCSMCPNMSQAAMESTLLYNLGQAHVRSRHYQQAKEWFQMALETVPQDSTSELNACMIFHNLGNCCYRMGENDQAMEHYQNALLFANSIGMKKLDIAASYNCVAVLQFHKSSPTDYFATCREFLYQSLSIYTAILGEISHQVATVLSNIGRVHFIRQEYREAFDFFQKALVIRQATLEADSIDIATAQFNVGQTHHRLGQLKKAQTHYQTFLELAQSQLGKNHRDYAAGLVLLSDVHRDIGEYHTSQLLLEDALQSGRAALGHKHPDLALILNNLGNLSYELHNYNAALDYYMECVSIQQEFLDPKHTHVVISLLNIAQIYKAKGDFDNAFGIYHDVYSIHLDTCGSDSLDVTTCISSMGLMKYLAKDYRIALNFYREALRLHRLNVGNRAAEARDADLASTLNSIGLVLFKMHEFDASKDAFVECLDIRRRLLGDNSKDTAIIWYNLATIYLEKGQDQVAMKLYAESLRVERHALGTKNPEISLTLQHLGQMHQERGELEIAVKYFGEALEIERMNITRFQENSPTEQDQIQAILQSICKLLNLIGNIHLMCGNVDAMMACFKEACQLGNHKGDRLIIAGHNFYGLSRLHPPAAPIA